MSLRRAAGSALAALLLAALGACRAVERAAVGPPAPAVPGTWVVDPEQPGANLPPAGRSLFDLLLAGERGDGVELAVPFPFPALVRHLEARLGGGAGGASPFKQVLIPLGRSLQRDAAPPGQAFRYPRLVVAADGEAAPPPGDAGALVKDRLYLGYQENARIVEVISYNQAAGRFEFQVVTDYGPGGVPRVRYANRGVCTVCHQGAAPIFARQLWDETGANPAIRERLRAEGRDFYGLPLDAGVDVPYAIDNASDRAGLFAAAQKLWREGCGEDPERAVACRAAILTAALQYRLSGGRFEADSAPYRRDFVATAADTWRRRWPDGLLIPDPDLPNRDPLAGAAPAPDKRVAPVPADKRVAPAGAGARLEAVLAGSRIPAGFEPLDPRPPGETWTVDGGDVERVVAGIAAFFAERDVRRLDRHLRASTPARGDAVRTLRVPCALAVRQRGGLVERIKMRCPGPAAADAERPLELLGRVLLEDGRPASGIVEQLRLAAERRHSLAVDDGTLRFAAGRLELDLALRQPSSDLGVRLADGRAIAMLRVLAAAPTGDGETTVAGEAELTVVDDFAALRAAVQALAAGTRAGRLDALSDAPFRRAAVLPALEAALGLPPRSWPAEAGERLPPPRLEAGVLATADDFAEPAIKLYYRYCGACHAAVAPSPPNFLYGHPEAVRERLAHCGERIFYRLDMWRYPRGERPKTPMPPENALDRLTIARHGWPDHPDLAALTRYAGDRLQTSPRAVRDSGRRRGYERLARCLP